MGRRDRRRVAELLHGAVSAPPPGWVVGGDACVHGTHWLYFGVAGSFPRPRASRRCELCYVRFGFRALSWCGGMVRAWVGQIALLLGLGVSLGVGAGLRGCAL